MNRGGKKQHRSFHLKAHHVCPRWTTSVLCRRITSVLLKGHRGSSEPRWRVTLLNTSGVLSYSAYSRLLIRSMILSSRGHFINKWFSSWGVCGSSFIQFTDAIMMNADLQHFHSQCLPVEARKGNWAHSVSEQQSQQQKVLFPNQALKQAIEHQTNELLYYVAVEGSLSKGSKYKQQIADGPFWLNIPFPFINPSLSLLSKSRPPSSAGYDEAWLAHWE